MTKRVVILLLAVCLGSAYAQNKMDEIVPMSFDTVGADTARAVKVIDRHVRQVDFGLRRTDSVLCVVSKIIDRSHPNDTMTIYRWYMSPRYNRTEIWQGGRMQDGFYSDGVKLFRKFHNNRREWANLTADSYYRATDPLDIRGALYDWRNKGSEVFYAGEATYEGKVLDRIFSTTPRMFDRYYFFERESGLLGFLIEEGHIYGDSERAHNAVQVDWHAYHEYVPVNAYYLPKEESYQVEGEQIVILRHTYHYEAPDIKIFTEDFYQHTR